MRILPKFIQNFFLSNLNDVSITAPSNAQVLTFDGSSQKWMNKNPATGGGGTSSGGFTDSFSLRLALNESVGTQSDSSNYALSASYSDSNVAPSDALTKLAASGTGYSESNITPTELSSFVAVYTATGTFVAPKSQNYTIECWGGGQGGAAGTSTGGTGGKGGDYARSVIALVSGTTYTVTVGAASAVAGVGNDSWFSTATTIRAKGGNSANSTIGTTTFTGGTGATGTLLGAGGGGGAGAGSSNAGANGSGATGGAAANGGGSGGGGTTGAGTAGSAPGGGGGGGGGSLTSPGAGSAGARGEVRLTFSL